MARLVFMGTPDFAVPSLHILATEHNVTGVVSQPDRSVGRGLKLRTAPVNQAARALGIPVITPTTLTTSDALSQIAAWQPELIVVVAYGHLLRSDLLEIPPRGCLNVHASLLPRHRGASPVAAAIISGDTRTGVTIMKIDAGLDTGPVLTQHEITIDVRHTTKTLSAELATLGAQLLRKTIPRYLSGKLRPRAQEESLATYAPKLRKEDGQLHFSQTALELERQVRAMQPWPVAFALRRDQPFRVLQAQAALGSASPGLVLRDSGNIAVGTGAGLLFLKRIQPPGKRAMTPEDYARGAPDFVGDTLT